MIFPFIIPPDPLDRRPGGLIPDNSFFAITLSKVSGVTNKLLFPLSLPNRMAFYFYNRLNSFNLNKQNLIINP